jgi:hypothetical protein
VRVNKNRSILAGKFKLSALRHVPSMNTLTQDLGNRSDPGITAGVHELV